MLPNCSPLCDHVLICKYCQRMKCRDNLKLHKTHGIVCACGSNEWIPVDPGPKKTKILASIDAVKIEYAPVLQITARQVYEMLCKLPPTMQFEVITQCLSRDEVYDDVKRWVNAG